MWSAVVILKDVQTGKEFKRLTISDEPNRMALENKIYELVGKDIDLKKEYYIAHIDSPIGFFSSDPTGWEIYNMQKSGMLG
jgi:hypothetical protein